MTDSFEILEKEHNGLLSVAEQERNQAQEAAQQARVRNILFFIVLRALRTN